VCKVKLRRQKSGYLLLSPLAPGISCAADSNGSYSAALAGDLFTRLGICERIVLLSLHSGV
jgi:hypothetical protein